MNYIADLLWIIQQNHKIYKCHNGNSDIFSTICMMWNGICPDMPILIFQWTMSLDSCYQWYSSDSPILHWKKKNFIKKARYEIVYDMKMCVRQCYWWWRKECCTLQSNMELISWFVILYVSCNYHHITIKLFSFC